MHTAFVFTVFLHLIYLFVSLMVILTRRILYTLPPLTRERTYDRDVRPIPSRFTKFMDHSPAQDEQPRYARSTPLGEVLIALIRRICTDSETYHDSRQQRPVSLSVFNAPTATYAWERYEPESQIPYPRPLYVDYTGRSSTRSASSSSISSLLDSPGMPCVIMKHCMKQCVKM